MNCAILTRVADSHGIEDVLTTIAMPSWPEVLRAKRAILDLLADAEPHGVGSIQQVLHVIDDVPVHLGHRPKLEVANVADVASVVVPTHPIVAHIRLAWAATEALVDLVSLGVVVEVADSPAYETSHPIIAHDRCNISCQVAGHGFGVDLRPPFPQLARAYRLTPRHAVQAPWFAEPDLFMADLDGVFLDDRAKRCIDEALAAFRHGLFLACANLLGAASEAAWYASGERLRQLDPQLGKALDDDRTAKVIDRVKEVLRQRRSLSSAVDDVGSTAALLRELRNYGAHPRSDETAHLERYFSEASSAILLMETHSYLMRLCSAVTERLASEA